MEMTQGVKSAVSIQEQSEVFNREYLKWLEKMEVKPMQDVRLREDTAIHKRLGKIVRKRNVKKFSNSQ